MILTPEERECLTEAETELLDVMEVAAMEPEFHTEQSLVATLADLARTRLALKQEREDHERTAWAVRNKDGYPRLKPQWQDIGEVHVLDWDLYIRPQVILGLGSETIPKWTPEARAAVDKARKEA